MRPWWAPRREQDADDRVLGEPGPVLTRDGAPVVGPDGEPLEKVLVVTRRDWMGSAEESVWVNPRIGWQYNESEWS